MSEIQIIEYPRREHWAALLSRPVIQTENLESGVRKILDDVKKMGDNAILKYSVLFDHVQSMDLFVREEEFATAEKALDEKLKIAIQQAEKNISKFHKNQQIRGIRGGYNAGYSLLAENQLL